MGRRFKARGMGSCARTVVRWAGGENASIGGMLASAFVWALAMVTTGLDEGGGGKGNRMRWATGFEDSGALQRLAEWTHHIGKRRRSRV